MYSDGPKLGHGALRGAGHSLAVGLAQAASVTSVQAVSAAPVLTHRLPVPALLRA
jgi:hypothetical protein